MIPYAGVSFWAHDWVGDVLRSKTFAKYTLSPVPPRNERERRHPKLKSYWEALAGGIAGLLAQTSSYPIEVVRRRMQVAGTLGNHEFQRFWPTVQKIYSASGFKGFYVGLSIGYFKVCVCQFESNSIGCPDGVLFVRCMGTNEVLVGFELEICFCQVHVVGLEWPSGRCIGKFVR
jgi:Mitochondrial carrier protein